MLNRTRRAGAAIAIAGAVVAAVAAPRSAAAESNQTENWNQLAEDAEDGVVRGMTKLAIGFNYARAGDSTSPRLAGEFEHLLRNRWGLTGSGAVSLSGSTTIVPASLGFRFHFLPKTWFDPYVGLAGGLAWVRPSKKDDIIAPLVDLRLGLAIYFAGLSFFQVDGGYDFMKYSAGGVGLELGGIIVTGRIGVFF